MPCVRWSRASRPTSIVNAAAYTAVDRAEDEPELARAVNALALGVIGEAARAARRRGAALLDRLRVRRRRHRVPYREDDATGPTGVYGLTKLDGRAAARRERRRRLVFRTAWVLRRARPQFPAHDAEARRDARAAARRRRPARRAPRRARLLAPRSRPMRCATRCAARPRRAGARTMSPRRVSRAGASSRARSSCAARRSRAHRARARGRRRSRRATIRRGRGVRRIRCSTRGKLERTLRAARCRDWREGVARCVAEIAEGRA